MRAFRATVDSHGRNVKLTRARCIEIPTRFLPASGVLGCQLQPGTYITPLTCVVWAESNGVFLQRSFRYYFRRFSLVIKAVIHVASAHEHMQQFTNDKSKYFL